MPLKRAVRGLLSRTASVWSRASALRRPATVVLTYHRILEGPTPFRGVPLRVFQQQVEWIARHCDARQPCDVVGTARRRSTKPVVLITFDDGYRDFGELACPVLRKAGVPAINFVPTHYVDTGEPFWWDRLEWAVHRTREDAVVEPWSGQTRPLDADGRVALLRDAKRRLKAHARPDRAPLFDQMLTALGPTDELPRQVMTWSDIRSAGDIATFGGHTHTHASMHLLDDPDVQWESEECFARLAAETHSAPACFAYPNGAYDDRAERAILASGFTAGFTTVAAYVPGSPSPAAVPRFHAPDSLGELVWILSGWRT